MCPSISRRLQRTGPAGTAHITPGTLPSPHPPSHVSWGGWTVTSPELSYLAPLNNYHLPSPGGPGPPAAGSAARKAGGWSPEAGEPPAQLGRFTGKPCQRSNSDVSERSWNVDCTSAWRQRVGPGAPMPHPPGGGGVFLSLSLRTDLVQEEPAPSSSLAIRAAELPSWPPAPSLQLWPPPPTRPHATHHSTPGPAGPAPGSDRKQPSARPGERAQEWVAGCLGRPLSGQGLKRGPRQLPKALGPRCASRDSADGQSLTHSFPPQTFTECRVGAGPGGARGVVGRMPGPPRGPCPAARGQVTSHCRRGFAGVSRLEIVRWGGDPA